MNETAELIGSWNRDAEGIRVVEVYGNIPNGLFGSGRAEHALPRVSNERFVEYIQVAEENGIGFCYTLNPSCLSNREYTSEGFLEILTFVAYLVHCGVDRLVIALPPLIEIVRRHFPKVRITASVICRIDTIEKARFYEDLGVDRINIPDIAARDFDFIDALSRDVRAELQVIVNSPCMVHCPIREYHYNCGSHATSSGGNVVPTPWMRRCHLMRLDPSNQLKRPALIRPEDLGIYEQHGVRIFKVIGREAELSDYVKGVIQEYLDQRHIGNYFELLPRKPSFRHPFYLDNEELDGFLDFFVEQRPRCQLGCYDCKYCERMARNIRFDGAEVDSLAESFRQEISRYLDRGN